MSILQVDTQPLIARNKPYPPGVGSAPDAVLRQGGQAAQELAQALHNIEAQLNMYAAVLRQQSTVVDKIAVVDAQGKVLAALGDFIFAGVPATNYFSELHAGDPLNTGDPSQALFNANVDGSVTIGQHGWLQVLDPYGADAAWIGTQFDTLPVTGAVASGALIRVTVTGHTLATGDVVQVRKVVGVTSATNGTSNANGTWTITKIDANHVDLQSSVFVGAYVSGGTIDRLLHVTGAANNGGGLIRLTVAAHGYESGDRVNVRTVGGVPNAAGQWIISVISANTFDLVGSTFAGAYTSGGTALRYFGGGLFQTIAIGPSFANYKLRAFADGSLKIKDASITINGPTGIVEITNGTIRLRSVANPSQVFTLSNDAITLANNSGLGVGFFQLDGQDGLIEITNNGATKKLDLVGALGQLLIDGGTTPADSQILLKANALGALSLLNYAANNQIIGFDCEWTGSALLARHAVAVFLHKTGGKLQIKGSAGNTIGTAVVQTVIVTVDPATGFVGFGGNAAPAYDVDAALDVNAGGVFRVAGTQVVGAQLAAVSAPSIATTTISATAGATYTATEQGMLNSLKAAVNQLNTDVANLATAINDIRARLAAGTGHGLTA